MTHPAPPEILPDIRDSVYGWSLRSQTKSKVVAPDAIEPAHVEYASVDTADDRERVRVAYGEIWVAKYSRGDRHENREFATAIVNEHTDEPIVLLQDLTANARNALAVFCERHGIEYATQAEIAEVDAAAAEAARHFRACAE